MSDIVFVALSYLAALGTYVLYAAALESRIRRTKAVGRRLTGLDRQGEAPTNRRTTRD